MSNKSVKTDKRIARAYQSTCCGVQISVLDIGKIYAVGRQAVAAGASDVVLAFTIKNFVETIRKN